MTALLFVPVAVALAALVLVAVARIALGPTIPDRVVGLDTANTLIVSAFLALAAAYGQVIYVDIAIVYAMLSFVSTLFIAKYVEESK